MPGRAPSAASRPPVATSAHRGLLAVALAVVAVLLAGCSPGASTGDGPTAGPAPVGAAATSTRGAELRAALTWLLTERAHLVVRHARAVAAPDGGSADPEVVTARRALNESARSTAELLGGSYSGARAQLLPALRAHDAALLARTAPAGTPVDDASADRALAGAREDLAAAVRRVVPRLRAQDVDDALAGSTASVVAASEAAASGDPRAAALQRRAHEAAWTTARLLAVGVSSDRGLGLAGSPATELRGRLTGLLVQHALLSGELAERLREAAGDVADPQVSALEDALDAGAVSLGELLGRSAPDVALPVVTAWRAHLADVRALAVARTTGQPAPPAALDAVTALQQALQPHADTLPLRAGELGRRAGLSLRTAVDAAATGSPDAGAVLRAAAADTVAPAALLSAALAQQLALS